MEYLLVITQAAGIFLLVSTMVLLFFRRVYLDAETKQPIKFKLPIIGELSTQTPVLVLVAIGASMVLYPISQMRAPMVSLDGDVDTGGDTVSVLIVAVPDYEQIRHTPGSLKVNIPLLNTQASYRALFVVGKQIIAEQEATPTKGQIKLKQVQWSPPSKEGPESRLALKKDISDEELLKLSAEH